MKKKILLSFIPVILIAFVACKDPGIAKREKKPEILSRTVWNAAEPKPFARQEPVRITVHHEGTKLLATDDAIRKIKGIQTWGMETSTGNNAPSWTSAKRSSGSSVSDNFLIKSYCAVGTLGDSTRSNSRKSCG